MHRNGRTRAFCAQRERTVIAVRQEVGGGRGESGRVFAFACRRKAFGRVLCDEDSPKRMKIAPKNGQREVALKADFGAITTTFHSVAGL